MTDRNLEEAIFQLQKVNTENGVKQLVEEAAQLFSNGRHMEASALMEKAEAMMARPGKAPVAPPERVKTNETLKDEAPKMDEQAVSGMAVKLADGLSRILTGAFEELERHIVGESRKLNTSFEQQLERLHSAVESLGQLKTKFDQLTEALSEQKAAVSEQKILGAVIGQKYDQLSGTMTSLQETSVRHETELGALRGEAKAIRAETGALRGETTALRGEAVTLHGETAALRGEAKEFSTSALQKMDRLSTLLALHSEELAGMKGAVSDISRKMAGFIERVDRQADVIRSLSETQSRRAAALEELLAVLTRLKTPDEPLVAAAMAGQL